MLLTLLQAPLVWGNDLSFRHITSREGLPFTWVRDISKDAEGFMWFSTIYGACRYDGQRFEEFSFQREGNNSCSSVYATRPGREGTIWFCTDGGLFCYDPRSGKTESPILRNHAVFDMAETSDGRLWVATSRGVYVIEKDSEPEIVKADGIETAISATALLLDSRDALWFGTSAGELLRYDIQKKALIPAGLPEMIKAPVYALLEDKSNNLWISTSGDGVYRWSRRDESLLHWCVQNGGLQNNLARQMVEDAGGNIWIATEKGLAEVTASGATHFVLGSSENLASLNDNAVYSAFCDEDGVLWFGTFFGGVNLLYPEKYFFDVLLSNGPGYSGRSKVVSSIVPCGDDLLMVGTENAGAFLVGDDGSIFSHIGTGDSSIASDNVHSVCRDDRGNLWIGTYYGGLFCKAPGAGMYGIRKFNTSNSALTVNNIYVVRQDSRDNLWIGTQNGGLYRYDYKSSSLERFPASLPGNLFVWDIREGSDGNIYLATFGGGFWRLSVRDAYAPERIPTPAGYYINICELRDGRILLGTEKEGLTEYKPSTGECRQIGRQDGLPDDTVYGILQDASGDIWMSSNSGLTRADVSLEHFTNYTMDDGLPANRFNYNACVSADGVLYFGSTNGVVTVRPDKIDDSFPKNARIHFNTLYVNNEKVTPGGKTLPVSLDSARKLVLTHRQGSFGIDFSDNLYDRSRRKYAYMMQGLNSDWHFIGRRRHIDFLSLRPGRYTLHIAPVIDGREPESIADLQVRILPPWYLSAPAIILYVLLLIFGVRELTVKYVRRSRSRHQQALDKLAREKDDEINATRMRYLVNSSADERLVGKVADYVTEHISDNNLDIESLCAAVGVSKTSLYRKMKAVTGQSAGEFIIGLRVKHAARMLRSTDRTVSEIAYESGFTDPYYFSRAFKKYYGASPKNWRSKNTK